LFTWAHVLVLMRSMRFENTVELMPSSAPPLREHTCMRTSLTTWKATRTLAFFCAFLFLNAHSHLLEDIHWQSLSNKPPFLFIYFGEYHSCWQNLHNFLASVVEGTLIWWKLQECILKSKTHAFFAFQNATIRVSFLLTVILDG
jgi:hypothetical protein